MSVNVRLVYKYHNIYVPLILHYLLKSFYQKIIMGIFINPTNLGCDCICIFLYT